MATSDYPLSTVRHSASHVLAQAVLKLFPDAKLGIGPAIDEGFYYDFELPRSLNDDDLKVLEKNIRRIIAEKQVFEQFDRSRAETEDLLVGQPFKEGIVADLNLDDYSFYENGPFRDLCRGPHVGDTSEIGVVKLLSVAGAYWRGDETQPMLQRIYGTAFYTQEELDAYLLRLEEAKKRDHRVIGKAQGLFSVQDEIGPGLILWHPKGARIRNVIEQYWKDAHYAAGYEMMFSPHVGRAKLWETSGHLGFYDENMFSSIEMDNGDYYVRPMNCPFHIMVYKDKLWSYRELPFRVAELGTVYRYERSGVLHGLMRVRGFTQDDAHIFCSKDQVDAEVRAVLGLCLEVLKTFGFEKYEIFVSTRPQEKYVGEISDWEAAELALKSSVEAMGLDYQIDEGGGAFYGPKIDIKIEDAIGRKWQCSTVQFDFNLPERFDLTYVGADGGKHRPFMVHRALLGSIERFFGILIEQYAGRFPFWLAPVQVKVLALNSDVHGYCDDIRSSLSQAGVRVDVDSGSEKLGKKIRLAQTEQVPFMLVVGRKEMEDGLVAVRSREEGDLGAMSLADFLVKVKG